MRQQSYWWLAIGAVVFMALGIAVFSGETAAEAANESSVTSEEAVEQARPPVRERGEQRERREGRGEEGEGEHEGGEEGEGEHGEEHGEEGEEGEESGVYIAREEIWDVTRRGARLVLSFDAAANAFVGAVENTTERTLCAVRVEVHLGEGPELGPTERTDVPSGEKTAVRLSAEGQDFETWTAHPEVSACGGM